MAKMKNECQICTVYQKIVNMTKLETSRTFFSVTKTAIQMLEILDLKFMAWGRPCADPTLFTSYSQSKPTGVCHPNPPPIHEHSFIGSRH